VELVDTAGLRNTDNPIEQAGVSRARTQMQEADLILLVHDLQTPWGETEAAVQGEYPRCLVVHNKSDLVPTFVCPPGDVCSSAIASSGIDRLASAIAARLVPQPPPPQTPVPFTTCLIAQLRAARAAVTQADDQAARSILARCVFGS
jgi:tRNA modification GTPase